MVAEHDSPLVAKWRTSVGRVVGRQIGVNRDRSAPPRQKLRCTGMATLHFISGKAGAGKTTLARQIARTVPAVLICEDQWISRLADPVENLQQYLAASARIRSVIGPLSVDLLKLGTSVVFDFAGNTVNDRRWIRSIFERATADHRLHYVPADDGTCRARIRQRNVSKPEGVFFGVVTDQQVDEVNKFFAPPAAEEGFTTVIHET
jgi:predicted kinase